MTTDSLITIRPLARPEEFHQAEDVQRSAWHMTGERSIVPLNILLAIQKYGGLAAGAFDESQPEQPMIGFVLGFLGFTSGGAIKHCSHMLGVIPTAQKSNVGYRLKAFQRSYVLKQGLDLITWTYDPLEGMNARLNIGKLGCLARTYHYNFYGDWADGINQGLATDRFEVEWWIRSERVESRVERRGQVAFGTLAEAQGRGYQTILRAVPDKAGIVHPETDTIMVEGKGLIVEIPSSFQTVKLASMTAAKAWRGETAKLFTTLFAKGYAVVDFVRDEVGRCNAYLLTPTPSEFPPKG
ncbi:MAG TPA: hypothetical protein PLD47_18350 [Aggregatilineales bacterium]|nr:hypothetical protein [Anaerolineales bacterium]HRE49690.1 hypothetical protein [Aggregatilineales bacterium]